MDICRLMAPVTNTQWQMSASCCSVDPFTLPYSQTVSDQRSGCRLSLWSVTACGLVCGDVQEWCLSAALSHAILSLTLVPLQSLEQGSKHRCLDCWRQPLGKRSQSCCLVVIASQCTLNWPFSLPLTIFSI